MGEVPRTCEGCAGAGALVGEVEVLDGGGEVAGGIEEVGAQGEAG